MPDAMLDAEFRTFARYLGWRGPIDGLSATYARLHAAAAIAPRTDLDQLLVRLASHGWLAVTLADAYGRLAVPHGVLRRKLVLVLAILESSRVSHADFEAVNAAPMLETWLRLGVLGARWAITSVLAVLVIGPLHALAAVRAGGARG